MAPIPIRSATLDQIEHLTHGFFTRKGGVSTGQYASLNTGLGADEDNTTILKNRELVRQCLAGDVLVTPYQYHSAEIINVTTPWDWQTPPKADGLVTDKPGIVLAINTADCTPVIFADRQKPVIGIVHSGWKGTVGGALEATLEAMQGLGSSPGDVVAAIGPTISQENYEVGPEFVDQFIADNPQAAQFFTPAQRPGHAMFDLPGCVENRLEQLGLGGIENLVADQGLCTYKNEDLFFSYRRMTHRGEPDYGRQMSAICLR